MTTGIDSIDCERFGQYSDGETFLVEEVLSVVWGEIHKDGTKRPELSQILMAPDLYKRFREAYTRLVESGKLLNPDSTKTPCGKSANVLVESFDKHVEIIRQALNILPPEILEAMKELGDDREERATFGERGKLPRNLLGKLNECAGAIGLVSEGDPSAIKAHFESVLARAGQDEGLKIVLATRAARALMAIPKVATLSLAPETMRGLLETFGPEVFLLDSKLIHTLAEALANKSNIISAYEGKKIIEALNKWFPFESSTNAQDRTSWVNTLLDLPDDTRLQFGADFLLNTNPARLKVLSDMTGEQIEQFKDLAKTAHLDLLARLMYHDRTQRAKATGTAGKPDCIQKSITQGKLEALGGIASLLEHFHPKVYGRGGGSIVLSVYELFQMSPEKIKRFRLHDAATLKKICERQDAEELLRNLEKIDGKIIDAFGGKNLINASSAALSDLQALFWREEHSVCTGSDPATRSRFFDTVKAGPVNQEMIEFLRTRAKAKPTPKQFEQICKVMANTSHDHLEDVSRDNWRRDILYGGSGRQGIRNILGMDKSAELKKALATLL